MHYNFRCKNVKDIETAEETLIMNPSYKNSLTDVLKTKPKPSVTFQREMIQEFDDLIEKKK